MLLLLVFLMKLILTCNSSSRNISLPLETAILRCFWNSYFIGIIGYRKKQKSVSSVLNKILKTVFFLGEISQDLLYKYVKKLCFSFHLYFERNYWISKYIEFHNHIFNMIMELKCKADKEVINTNKKVSFCAINK